ncbi:MAG TPA: sensor histidine kinase [Streptosporangiaceae bacterium]|nr:sensor histidine kinase [Streptosporangiaceae bacterium]
MSTHPPVPRALVRAWRDTAFVAAGVPLHLLLAPGWIWLMAITIKNHAWAAVPVPIVILLLGSLALTALQGRRYRGLPGMNIPGPRPTPGQRASGRALRWLRSPQTWRQIVYHVLLGPPLAFAELLVLAMWGAGIASTTISAWIWIVPLHMRLSHLGSAVFMVYLTVGGLAMLFLAPGLAAAVTRMETRLAPALLGPSRAQQLQRRVEVLAESRADLVEAADPERRRIERDLHDGTQQHLVSLAVNLGLARATLTDLPDEARKVIDEAHREAKDAIAELNDLVRGLHPAVLEDRGLDAALSGVAARVPYPVRLRVDVDVRPAPTVESVAYFVVSEALTNITKHAQATHVDVTVKRIGKMLRVNITDNGTGGADPSAGTGLSGLAKRVRSIDGTFRIASPAGGPTTIAVELPCEL